MEAGDDGDCKHNAYNRCDRDDPTSLCVEMSAKKKLYDCCIASETKTEVISTGYIYLLVII